MELKRIKLNNFRGYQNIDIVLTNGLQMFVGKNDIGKSTIFEALDIFLNEKNASTKISSDDLNVLAKSKGEYTISITCCFSLSNEDTVTIETVEISPEKEYLLNADGFIEVVKEWEYQECCTLKTSTYLICNLPDVIPVETVALKQADLKKKVKEFKIEEDVNQTTNSSMRMGLYAYYLKDKVVRNHEEKVPTKNFLAEKDILENIAKSFPDFYLFKADRKNSTNDDEIQNPMGLAVKRAFEEESVKSKLIEIETIVKNQLNEVNMETIEKLKELNVDYGNELVARITTNWSTAVKNDILDGNEIPINKRGSGIRRLLLLSYLMVEAQKKSYISGKKNTIFAIEEPETSLHPYMQKKFINQLVSLSEKNRYECGYEIPSNANELSKYQVLLTTHLPNFVGYSKLEQIIYLYKNSDGYVQRYLGDDIKEFIQEEMGKMPIIDYKYVIFVEGDNDVVALKNIGSIVELKSIFDINSPKVDVIPLNGSNLLKCIECDYYWSLPVKQYHLYDSDIEKYKTEVIDIKCNTEENKLVRGRVTELKEMENYIPKTLIECTIGVNLDAYKDNWQNREFNIVDILLSQSDTSVEQFNKIKKISNYKEMEKAMKNYLNKTVLIGVTKELLVEHGVFEEIKKWFEEMKDLHDFTE